MKLIEFITIAYDLEQDNTMPSLSHTANKTSKIAQTHEKLITPKQTKIKIKPNKTSIIYSPILLDVSDISSILKINSFSCTLTTKQNNSFLLLGEHKHLANRWIYSVNKKYGFVDDTTLRPSLPLLYNPHHFECDTIHFDKFQAYGFIMSYNKESLMDKFNTETQEYITEAKSILDKI